jgi:predicted histone-like DNA-binding protein
MSQKVQIYKLKNEKSKSHGKYFVRAVYDKKFITTEELSDFIQTQASVKRSDCKAVLDELGAAMKHFFELGQKIKLDNIGIFKVGVTSSPSDTQQGCSAANVKKSRVLFTPEVESIATGETGTVTRGDIDYLVPVYNHPAVMLKDVRFELAHNALGDGTTANETAGGNGGGNSGGDDDDQPIVNP